MKKFGFFLLALSVFAFTAAAQEQQQQQQPQPAPMASQASKASDDTVVEEIVARVNNSIITRADLRRAHDQVVQEVQQQNPPNASTVIAERDKDQLRDLINQQLLIQKANDLGYSADTELIKRLDEIRKQVGAKDMDELEKAAEQQGVSFEDFKNNLKNQILSQMVISREVGSHIQVTPAEVQKYYDEHKSEIEQPERVRLSEILVPVSTPKGADGKDDPNAGPSPEDVAAAQAKAEGLLKQIRGGAAFEDIAKANSAGPTAAQGGDLGYFKRGTLAKELEDKTFAMKAGDISDVIRTKQGFVILKVTEHQQAGVPDLKTMEPRIQEVLYYQKLDPALQEYFKKLREDAYIDVKPGWVDTGTVAGQTKPIITDELQTKKEVAEKEKKKKKRFLIF